MFKNLYLLWIFCVFITAFYCHKDETLWTQDIMPLPVEFNNNNNTDTAYIDTFNLKWIEKSTLPEDIVYDVFHINNDTLVRNLKQSNFVLNELNLYNNYNYKIINRRQKQGFKNEATFVLTTQHDPIQLGTPTSNGLYYINDVISFSWTLRNRFFHKSNFRYIVYVDTISKDFKAAIKIDNIKATQISHILPIKTQRQCYWKVGIVYDNYPDTIWSNVGTFKILNRPPSTPIIIAPSKGYIVPTATSPVIFKWQKSIDPEGEAVSYRLVVKDTSNKIILDKSNITTTEYTLSQYTFLSPDTYTFFVQASDPQGNTSTSELAHFNVQTYNIFFNTQGGSVINKQKLIVGTSGTKPANPIKAGYSFVGWYADSLLTNAFNFSSPITRDTMLYAKWDIIVTFINTNNNNAVLETRIISAGSKLTPPADLEQYGYTFLGWTSNLNTSSTFDFNTPITQTLTIYTKWSINYYLVFFNTNGDGQNIVIPPQSIPYLNQANKPEDPTQYGYTFAGWYYDNQSFMNAYNFNSPITQELNLYAQWRLNKYKVNFDTKAGNTVNPQTIEYKKFANAPNVYKVGHHLDRWYSDTNFTQAFDMSSTPITRDTTLYAHWYIDTYTVSFNKKYFPDNNVPQKVIYNEKATASGDTIQAGYTFQGWYKYGQNVFDFKNTPITSSISLEAKWILNWFRYYPISAYYVQGGKPNHSNPAYFYYNTPGKYYSYSTFPAGVTLDENTGQISWTGNVPIGTYYFLIQNTNIDYSNVAYTQNPELYNFELNIINPNDFCSAEQDKQALIDFYNAANGNDWKNKNNWLSNEPLGTWAGVSTEEGSGCVVSLDLEDNLVSGTLSPSLGSLSQLSYLRLNTNAITGSIPSTLNNAQKLKYINLYNNQLNSTIPDFNNLSNLEYLNLASNQISGTINYTITQLKSLKKLNTLILWNNQISEDIPDFIDNLSALSYLDISSNRLTGKIPDNIGNLLNLYFLNLSNNQLNNNIPDISRLLVLTYLNLSNNKLTGSIPVITNPNILTHLYLNNNQLTGAIPNYFSNLANIKVLDISNNGINGGIPDMTSSQNVYYLSMAKNNLNGNIPNIGATSSLVYLYFNDNQLSGNIPSFLSTLSNLWYVDVSHNNLSGSIPDMSNVVALKSMRMSHNKLTGSIPNIGSSSTLVDIYLNNNNLDGTLSDNLFYLSNLENLYLDSNKISGIIPDNINYLSKLKNLYLNNNQLTGTLPKYIYLPNVVNLYLNDNQLNDTIPRSIGNLSNVENLYLNNNKLKGTIPVSIGYLSKLQNLHLNNNLLQDTINTINFPNTLVRLSLHNNQIKGLVSNSLGWLSKLQYLNLSNNQFSGSVPNTICDRKKSGQYIYGYDDSENVALTRCP